MNLFETVQTLCNDNKISIAALERKLGLGNGTIKKWGTSTPSGDRLAKVADYFNVSVDYLLGRTAFRTPTELFEHWSGHNGPYFESAFDFGELLKAEREKQGISREEVSEALNITISDVENIEEGLLPLNYEWAEKYAKFLDTSVSQIFFDNNMYDEQVPEQFHDNVETYEVLKKAAEDEALKENLQDALKENTDNEIHTLAAHSDGEDWTEEELQDIENFKKFVLSKRCK